MFEGVEYFVTVVEEGGFAAAARKLRCSNGHVTKQIQRLEQRLGVQLLLRSTRSVKLTEPGARYFAQCQKIVAQAKHADELVRDDEARPSGKLKVTAPVSFGLSFLGDHLPEFLRRFPDIELDLDLNERRADLLAENIDVALRVGQLEDSSLVARKLSVMKGKIVASPSYWRTAGKPNSPKDLQKHTTIGFSLQRQPQVWSFQAPSGRLDIEMKQQVMTNSAEMELVLAKAGQGVARLPDFVCQRAINDGELETVLTEFSGEPVGIYALYPGGAFVPAKTRVFIDFLASRF